MNKTERLQAILTALQSKRIVRAEDLAERFEVSIRTIYRDIRSLEEAGIPIGAEAGIGYFITEGYYVPPVMFTQEEAMALLVAGKFISQRTDKKVNKAFESAVTKIKSVLDNQKKEQWEDLDNQILLNPFGESENERELFLESFKKALAGSFLVEVDYRTPDSETTTRRRLEPVGLTYYYQRWHLIAWCQLREAYRDFRLDRMEAVHVLSTRYKKNRHPSLKEYLNSMIKNHDLTEVRVFMKSDILRFVENSKYAMGMISEKKTAEGAEMVFATPSTNYFARWILSLGAHAKVLGPEEVKRMVVDISEAVRGMY
jgi:predicted DNA-binding transcriptional regulator YafY